jgi:hypothetical protein
MSAPSPSSPHPTRPWLAPAAIAGGLAAFGFLQWQHQHAVRTELATLTTAQTETRKVLDDMLGEVTRFRIEQSAGTKGPQALLEKLDLYAPLLSNSRVNEPDYFTTKKEMDSILRAFGTLGQDAWKPLQDRLAQCKPDKDIDKIKWLFEACARVDVAATSGQMKEVLLGRAFPQPRLRWFAAELLTRIDLPVAQTALRQILLTESSRGIDPTRAAHYGGGIPDKQALAATGFNNFVVAYVRTNDAKLEEILQQVIARSEHDAITVQECVKVLGDRKCAAAVPQIEKLYREPPLQQQNPLFLNYCLDALVEIQGPAAKPFLEQALPNAATDVVAKKIQFLLHKIDTGQASVEKKEPEKKDPAVGDGKK